MCPSLRWDPKMDEFHTSEIEWARPLDLLDLRSLTVTEQDGSTLPKNKTISTLTLNSECQKGDRFIHRRDYLSSASPTTSLTDG